ncbi:MAG: hypothetical protein K0V04_32015, partial [Deltaproteobacteria bacterium]|nr:hypothetical protein [Deltaproteobacteria bacterium]
GELEVVELVEAQYGELVLLTRRASGQLGLVGVSSRGQPRWATTPGLPCSPCTPDDIVVHPSGDIIVSATSGLGTVLNKALLLRYDPDAGLVRWVLTVPLDPGPNAVPQSGGLALLGDEHILNLRIDGSNDGEFIRLLDLDETGELQRSRIILAGLGTAGQWPPLLVATPEGAVVAAAAFRQEDQPGIQAATHRMLPPNYVTISAVDLPVPLDDLALDGTGRRIELARSNDQQTITLLITSRSASELARWDISLPFISTSSTRATLAVGPDDDVYVGVRTSPQTSASDPFAIQLEITRLSSTGQLRWQVAEPLDMMATNDPLELLIDEDEGIVVATVVEGRMLVRRYEQACGCR